MGYTTDFEGKLKLNKQLSLNDYRWLANFAGERHEGEEADNQKMPGIWCQWIPSEDGWFIQWDEGEKFYDYVEWLQWLIVNFFQPNGYILNGKIKWNGEEQGDVGVIIVKNNLVSIQEKVLVNKCPYCKKTIKPEDLIEEEIDK
jgi:hypothetical protein